MFCHLHLAPICQNVYFVCVNKPTSLVSNSQLTLKAAFITTITSGVVHYLPQLKFSGRSCYPRPIWLLACRSRVAIFWSESAGVVRLEWWTVLAKLYHGGLSKLKVIWSSLAIRVRFNFLSQSSYDFPIWVRWCCALFLPLSVEEWSVLVRSEDRDCSLVWVGGQQSWRSFGVCLLSASDSTSCCRWAATFQSETAGVVRCSCHLAWIVDSVGEIRGRRVVIWFKWIIIRGGSCWESTKGFASDSDVQEQGQQSIGGERPQFGLQCQHHKSCNNPGVFGAEEGGGVVASLMSRNC